MFGSTLRTCGTCGVLCGAILTPGPADQLADTPTSLGASFTTGGMPGCAPVGSWERAVLASRSCQSHPGSSVAGVHATPYDQACGRHSPVHLLAAAVVHQRGVHWWLAVLLVAAMPWYPRRFRPGPAQAANGTTDRAHASRSNCSALVWQHDRCAPMRTTRRSTVSCTKEMLFVSLAICPKKFWAQIGGNIHRVTYM